MCNSVFNNLTCDNSGSLDNHKLILIKSISSLYLKIRIHSITKWKNSKKISKRKILSKVILNNND